MQRWRLLSGPESSVTHRTSTSPWAFCPISPSQSHGRRLVCSLATNPMKNRPKWIELVGKQDVCFILVIFLNGSDGKKKRNLYFKDWKFYLPNLRGRNFVPWQMMRWGWRFITDLFFSEVFFWGLEVIMTCRFQHLEFLQLDYFHLVTGTVDFKFAPPLQMTHKSTFCSAGELTLEYHR